MFVCRHLSFAKEGFTQASLGLLANQRRRQLLTGLLKSLRTIKTLVIAALETKHKHCTGVYVHLHLQYSFIFPTQQRTDVRLSEMLEVSVSQLVCSSYLEFMRLCN